MKRILLVVTMIILVLTLAGCSDSKKTETIVSSSVSVGNYLLFQTDDVDEYLTFLENFDEDQYEIVNIDTFVRETKISYNNDYYMVTYKKVK